MRLKKGVKRFLIVVLLLIIVGASFFVYFTFFQEKNTTKKQATVENEIKEYGYTLKSNKSKKYKEEFKKLAKILKEDPVDEEQYVKTISKMFILDFYTLNDKVANTDVGGVSFVHSLAIDNFLLKAEDTIYKYVESNMYDNREQDLPTVKDVSIEGIEQTTFTVGDASDDKAYVVKVSWDYEEDNDYQNEATLTFMHEDKKLSLVEME